MALFYGGGYNAARSLISQDITEKTQKKYFCREAKYHVELYPGSILVLKTLSTKI